MRLAGAEQVVTATKRFGSASYSYNCLGMTELGWLVAGDDDNAPPIGIRVKNPRSTARLQFV